MGFKDLFSSDADVLSVAPENRLDLAVSELSRYYMSVTSENELSNYTAEEPSSLPPLPPPVGGGGADVPSNTATRAKTQEVIRKVRSLIQDTSTGGLFATQILQKFNDDETLKEYPYIDRIVKIKYESHTPSPVNATVNFDNSMGINAQCGALRMPNPAASGSTALGGLEAQAAGIPLPVQGGNAQGIPDAIDNPCLSAIVINAQYLV